MRARARRARPGGAVVTSGRTFPTAQRRQGPHAAKRAYRRHGAAIMDALAHEYRGARRARRPSTRCSPSTRAAARAGALPSRTACS